MHFESKNECAGWASPRRAVTAVPARHLTRNRRKKGSKGFPSYPQIHLRSWLLAGVRNWKPIARCALTVRRKCASIMGMTSRRLLLIGLDGFDLPLAERFLAEGILPNFARFQKQAACYKLDHGRDKYSGLAWEQLSAGVSPSDGGRWSAVTFDKSTYSARQNHSEVRPFVADLSCRTVVFDFPYFDLARTPETRGITAWGAHDPGVAPACRPDTLYQELNARFGPYPAPEWIYGFWLLLAFCGQGKSRRRGSRSRGRTSLAHHSVAVRRAPARLGPGSGSDQRRPFGDRTVISWRG
jgi:hypothetical protein